MIIFLGFYTTIFISLSVVAQVKETERPEPSIFLSKHGGFGDRSSTKGLEMQSRTDNHNFSTEKSNNIENADKLARDLPGRYVNFDLIQLMSGLSEDNCPLSVGIGPLVIVNNDTTSLNYSQFFFNRTNGLDESEFLNMTNSMCKAKFGNPPFMMFHRLTPDMFSASEDDPSQSYDSDTTRFKRSTLMSRSLAKTFKTPFFIPKRLMSLLFKTRNMNVSSRQINTANLGEEPPQNETEEFELPFNGQIFKWFARIPGDVISCDNGTSYYPELSLFVIDAKHFANIAVQAWLNSTAEGREGNENGGAFFQEDDAEYENKTARVPQDEEHPEFASLLEETMHAEVANSSKDVSGPKNDSESPQNKEKILEGSYFISALSENFSCLYMRPEDANILKTEFTRNFTQEVTTTEGIAPFTLEFGVICNCKEKYSENITFKLPSDPSVVTRSSSVANQGNDKFVRLGPLAYPFTLKVKTEEHVDTLENTETLHHSHDEDDHSLQNQGQGLPIVKFNGHTCKVQHALPVRILFEQVDLDLPLIGSNGFMARVLLNKYYQEATGLQDVPTEDIVSKIELRKTALQFARLTGDESLVILFANGTRCNDTVIVRDHVLLVEHKHIFDQLQRLSFFSSLNKRMMQLIFESGTEQCNFTIHAFSRNDFGYGSCVYSGSRAAVDFLEPSCGNFKPLGSFVSRDEDLLEMTSSVEPSRSLGVVEDPTPVLSMSGMTKASMSLTASPSTSAEPSRSVTPTPSSSPSPSAEETSGLGFCFPGAAKATRPNGSFVRLDNLKVGDYVQDSMGKSTRVLAFVHANNDIHSTFLHLKTYYGDIILSPKHYVIVNKQLVTAEAVQIGDFLELHRHAPKSSAVRSPVIDIQIVRMRGLFNPITQSGTIAVAWSGFAVSASCFTASVDVATSSVMGAPLRWVNRYMGFVIPIVSHMLREGSRFWGQLLPHGTKIVNGYV